MRLLALVLLLVAGPTHAEVDWATGRVDASGVGPADLRAPSPAIARVAAERVAHTAARARLESALRQLPWAEGKAIDEKWLAGVLATAVSDEVQYQSDGSVVVRAHVELAPANTTAELVVDARKLAVRPMLGARIAAGAAQYAGPVRWVHAPPVGVPVVVAAGVRRGVLEISAAAIESLKGPVVIWIAEHR